MSANNDLAARALGLSAERFELILRRLADGVTIQDTSGRLLYANEAAAALVGFATPAELLAAPTADVLARFEILDEEGRPFPLERLPGRVALETGTSASETLCYRTRSTAQERWSIVHATAIVDDNGAPSFAINVFHDITEQRLAVERAQRSEQRVLFLAEAGELLASSLDYEATLASLAHLAVPRLADWCSIDMLGQGGRIERLAVVHSDPAKVRWAERLRKRHPPDPDDDLGVPRVLRTGEAQLIAEISADVIDSIHRRRPELADVLTALGLRSAMIVPLAAHGRTLGAITFISAESDRRFAESELRLAEELARRAALAIDNARAYREVEARAHASDALRFVADAVALLDSAGVVRLWNPAAATITGIPAEQILGRRLGDTVSGWDELERQLAVAPQAGQARSGTTLPVEVDGREIWLSFNAARFEGGTVYAFRDVSEERALDRIKGEFVATVSHELRTPLAAIYGAAVTLRRPDLSWDHPQRAALTAVIASETNRLSRIVDGILWASSLEAEAISITAQRCDLAALVDDVLTTARLSAPPSITLERAGSDPPPAAHADPAKLVQVLTNLVDNAVKYSPEGGSVTIDVRAANPRSVRITVRDEGIGIAPGETERIFEKFYRLDPEHTKGVSGTGLGLYICRELVERMDGSIRAEPRTNGSEFVIELPSAE
jgi:PAS domain S-box-containing protein